MQLAKEKKVWGVSQQWYLFKHALSRFFQIPPELVVKSQAVDIAEVI
jgi:hypothetical protein